MGKVNICTETTRKQKRFTRKQGKMVKPSGTSIFTLARCTQPLQIYRRSAPTMSQILKAKTSPTTSPQTWFLCRPLALPCVAVSIYSSETLKCVYLKYHSAQTDKIFLVFLHRQKQVKTVSKVYGRRQHGR